MGSRSMMGQQLLRFFSHVSMSKMRRLLLHQLECHKAVINIFQLYICKGTAKAGKCI